ncbi:MAG: hypothetical protein M1826_007786 [Phylliscum demangeonii]|nr:MAG: hypothetical protein M1826_007786 [Phylliscum demangeonii]
MAETADVAQCMTSSAPHSKLLKDAMDDDVIRLRHQTARIYSLPSPPSPRGLTPRLPVEQLQQERARLKSAIRATAAASSLPAGPGTLSNARPSRTAVAAGRAAGDVQRRTLEEINANRGYEQHCRISDPYAVDRGRVLGVRIEVCIKADITPSLSTSAKDLWISSPESSV